MLRVQGLALYGPMAASTRYRMEQYAQGLREQGIDLDMTYLLDDEYLRARYAGRPLPLLHLLGQARRRWQALKAAHGYDLQWVYAELFPMMPPALELKLLNGPFVLDLDDAFYLKYSQGRWGALKPWLGNKFDRLMGAARAVTAGNFTLVERATRSQPFAHWLPTVVDTGRYLPCEADLTRTFTVGWIGSPSTAPYLSAVSEVLVQLGRDMPLRFAIMGGKAPHLPGVEVVERPWSEAAEVDFIQGLDVGIMPLPDDEWARGKCAFKLVQYMACGVPVVASPVGANCDVVTPECGLLAGSTDEWLQALRQLRDSTDMRRQMGRSSRLRIEEHYSLDRHLPRLADILRHAARRV